jgi:hypothetical protein
MKANKEFIAQSQILRFALANEPIMRQLTVHKDNFDATFGRGSFVKMFGTNKHQSCVLASVQNLRSFYGVETIQYFISEYLQIKSAG